MTLNTTSLFSVTENFLCSLPKDEFELASTWRRARSWPCLDKLTVSSEAGLLVFEGDFVTAGVGFAANGLPTFFTGWVSIVFTSKLLFFSRWKSN